MAEARSTPREADRFLVGIVVGALLLLVLAVVAVIVGTRAPAPPAADPATPLGVVQAYVDAVRAGEVDRAYALLSRAAQGGVSLEEYRRRFARAYGPSSAEQRILIEPLRVGPETAEARVTVSRFTASREPFSTSASHQDVAVHLVREDGAWRITQPIGPYPVVH
jgi:hypothetical protein